MAARAGLPFGPAASALESMNLSCAIRPASDGDLASLLPLFRDYQHHYGQLTSAGEEQTRAFLGDLIADPRSGFVLLAVREGSIVGFAAVYITVSGLIAQRIAHLGDLYVAPKERRSGVATALFDAVSQEARSRGIRLVRWLSLSSNTDLNRWYSRLVKPAGTFELFLRPTGAP
ncbi:hypothetical protein DB347_06435 [Opitutaceae bacterium EW11]|nr:hypothetical protein DB347_06435 [Opitutaceae bacterium EW11]